MRFPRIAAMLALTVFAGGAAMAGCGGATDGEAGESQAEDEMTESSELAQQSCHAVTVITPAWGCKTSTYCNNWCKTRDYGGGYKVGCQQYPSHQQTVCTCTC